MTLKGGTSQACAACKYQRRRCTAECPLAPYFPADKPKMFQNAHRLFGVSNIQRILKQLDPSQHMQAMHSVIFQATMREMFPVHGCCGFISQLYNQLRQAEEELHAVHTQLALCRQQQHHQLEIASSHNDTSSQLQLGMAPPDNSLSLFHNDTSTPQLYNVASALPTSTQHPYSNSNNDAYNSSYIDFKDNTMNSSWNQHPYGTSNNDNNDNNNLMEMQSQFIASQPLPIQQESAQDYDELHPFFDTIDDRQSYIDSKEASSESSLKDTTESIEQVAENELKNAAACLSLTSVN